MNQTRMQPELTFKANMGLGRHGWLRLTPAYSARLVSQLIRDDPRGPLLDPFAGTGTTVLSAAEYGVEAHGVDINPFLIWLCETKALNYGPTAIAEAARRFRYAATQAAQDIGSSPPWLPQMNNVEKWWSPDAFAWLGWIHAGLGLAEDIQTETQRLLAVAFCQLMIACAHVSFGHQSMSLRQRPAALFDPMDSLNGQVERVLSDARIPLPDSDRQFFIGDSTSLSSALPGTKYQRVVTSPPYANRVSYLRELRPYMIWLGFLSHPREAGELDWRAIGGTWGCATSNVAKWEPASRDDVDRVFDRRAFEEIRQKSDVLARYVLKYFVDAERHIVSVADMLSGGARVDYIVGNSKYYDTMVHTEELYARLFRQCGFERVSVHPVRKRSSKKELFEYRVEAWIP